MAKTYRFQFKLRELLKTRGISQKELAERTGLREATISEMVHDSRTVYNKEHIYKIMEVLNVCSLDEILELHIEEKPPE